MAQSDAFKMFMNKDNQFQLFPHGRIVHALDVYKTGVIENVQSILQLSDGITGTPVDKINPRGCHLYESVALRRVYPMHLGKVPRLRIDMDYFGYDVEDCIAHARLHISKMADYVASGTEDIKFFLKFPSQLTKNEMRYAVSNLGCEIIAESNVAIFDTNVQKLMLHSNI